jgi:hypothetical protein
MNDTCSQIAACRAGLGTVCDVQVEIRMLLKNGSPCSASGCHACSKLSSDLAVGLRNVSDLTRPPFLGPCHVKNWRNSELMHDMLQILNRAPKFVGAAQMASESVDACSKRTLFLQHNRVPPRTALISISKRIRHMSIIQVSLKRITWMRVTVGSHAGTVETIRNARNYPWKVAEADVAVSQEEHFERVRRLLSFARALTASPKMTTNKRMRLTLRRWHRASKD